MSLLDELQARLPADRIQVDPDVVGAYSQDRALFERPGTAAVLVTPRSTAEVVAAVQAAAAAGASVVPRGAGTGLCGAANAVDGCLMISLHKMDQILEIDTANRMARVQPGVINADLKAAVDAVGLFYPPDPASFDMSSIGGNVSTNAGGLCCVKYGVTRDYVIGLEVVLPNGEILRTGRHTLKRTTGLDLTGLFVGSEGALGIITEITVKLVPAPAPPSTAVAFFDHLPSAGRAICDIFEAGHSPSLMEIVDRPALVQVDKVYSMGLDTSAACLLLMQTSGDGASESIAAMARICSDHGATEVHHVDDPDEGAMFIEVRRRIWPAFEVLGLAMLPEDVAVPRQRLAELLEGIARIADEVGMVVPTVGHAGDGNMHPMLVFDGTDADATARARLAFAKIVELSLSLGGTIAAEHGIGTLKREHLPKELDPIQLRLQHELRRLFDPDGRFNPGKTL